MELVDKLTTYESKIAFQYIHGQLTNQIFNIYEGNDIDAIENDFPLSYLPKDRKINRKSLLDQIYKFNKQNYFQCCSAIKCFSKLLFTQYTLQKCLPKLNEQKKLPKEFREDAGSLRSLLEMHGIIQDNKIKNPYFYLILEFNDYVEGTLKSFSFKRKTSDSGEDIFSSKYLLSINRKIRLSKPRIKNNKPLNPFLIEASEYMLPYYLNKQAENEFLSKYRFCNIETNICHPQNLILDSLIWIIFIKFYQQQSREKAQKSTADLINEYCYHNPLLSSMTRKLTQYSIKHVLYETNFKEGRISVPFLKKLRAFKKSL